MNEMKDIPKHWQVKKLGEVCEIVMGQSPPSSTYNYNKVGLPFFQGKAEFTELYPLVKKWCDTPKKIAEKNDILLSVRAPVGSTNVANQKCCIGRGLAAIRFPNFKFIFYFLRSIENQLDKKGTGTTFKAISGDIIKKIEIPLPPLSEQKAIVAKIEELFSELENGKKQLQTALKQLKLYRQSLLKAAFEGRLTRETIKDGELPNGWKWVKLGEVCVNVDKVKKYEKNLNEEFLYLDISGIDNQLNKITDVKNYKWNNAPSRAQQIIIYEDVLFSTVRTYLKNIAFVNEKKYHKQIASTGFCIIRANKTNLYPKYIFYYCLTNIFLQPLNKLQTGSSYPAVRNKDVFSQPIPLPPLSEQQQIVNELESKLTVCDSIEATITRSLQQAETLRQSILKKAFAGKLTE